MKADLFSTTLSGWAPELKWGKADQQKALKLLAAISKANGGEIAPDIELDPETANEFAVRRAKEALMRKRPKFATAQQTLKDLQSLLDDVKVNPFGVARSLHQTRASTVLLERERRQRQALMENQVQSVKGASLLLDGAYVPFVEKLIAKAAVSISVLMFFMKYDPQNPKYVINAAVDGLIQAKQRGLDVRVILDQDPEGDVTESGVINQPAFEILTKSGVLVRYDSRERMTHSKLIVVDGRYTVLGSHNLTAGSTFTYDDTSVCLESVGLAAKFQETFNSFWQGSA